MGELENVVRLVPLVHHVVGEVAQGLAEHLHLEHQVHLVLQLHIQASQRPRQRVQALVQGELLPDLALDLHSLTEAVFTRGLSDFVCLFEVCDLSEFFLVLVLQPRAFHTDPQQLHVPQLVFLLLYTLVFSDLGFQLGLSIKDLLAQSKLPQLACIQGPLLRCECSPELIGF